MSRLVVHSYEDKIESMIAISLPHFSYLYHQPRCQGYRGTLRYTSPACIREQWMKIDICNFRTMSCQVPVYAMRHVPCRSRRAISVHASTSDVHLNENTDNYFGTAPELLDLLRRMIVFLLPLTALVLSEPLLVWCTSLFIGQFGTISELAALGPANIVIGE